MRSLFALSLLALVACPKTTTPAAPAGWAAMPRLPAPVAGSYARSPETPSDPPLAQFVRGKPWDASLSGAAAGLALQLVDDYRANRSRGLTRWRVREALWKAGYPYPVADARAWTGPAETPPPDAVRAWMDALQEGQDLGLVRARADDVDIWVAMRADRGIEVGRQPRQIAEGGLLRLPAVASGRYTVADANGHVLAGSLEQSAQIECNSAGEWMVHIASPQGEALFPVYVGLVPPELPLIDETVSVRNTADVLARTETLLQAVRDAYGTTPLERDFILDSGARALLRDSTTTPEAVKDSLGLHDSTAAWVCRSTTVEACIDSMLWRPENRRALLDDGSALGLAADVDATGVHVVGIVSRTH